MKSNKGVAFPFIIVIIFIIFAFITVVWKLGMNDIVLLNMYNDKSKSYYVAESGLYYGGSLAYEAVKSSTEPAGSVTVNNPFSEYIKTHSFQLTITKTGSDYDIISKGTYDGKVTTLECLATINTDNIVYRRMRIK